MIETASDLQQLVDSQQPIILNRAKSIPTSLRGGIISLESYELSPKIKILASADDLFDASIPIQLHRAVSFFGSDTFYITKVMVNKSGAINARATRIPSLVKRVTEFKSMVKDGSLIDGDISHIYGQEIWVKNQGVFICVKRPYNSHHIYRIGDYITLKVSYKGEFPLNGTMMPRRLKLDAVSSDLIVGKELKGVIVVAKPYGVFVKVSPALSILNDVPDPYVVDGTLIGREVLISLDKASHGRYHGTIVRAI